MSERLVRRRFPPPVDATKVREDWRNRGYSCEWFVDPPGREWNDFVHAANELVTVVDGQLALTVGEEKMLLEPGDEAFIPKGAIHSVKNVHHATTRWLFGYD